ncbi:DinB family protein [Vulcaniibacterium tengchongense]|uniref:DinB family protein n=1 Tax=Vulcaniibacterium tengchongense TaxID=1273429 RepID=A0A3N4VKF4_9GAMM|nr:DinB family protein [Vulcaniibacterium tengchongense]RPE79741.1 DinB family protein [Vulcaniibacterium tengchongense]
MSLDPATLAALAEFPRRLEAHYAAIPAGYANWAPPSWAGVPSEPFTPIEQLCHVRDVEIDGYQRRFRRVLEEERPFLPGISETLPAERCYAEADAAEVLARFRAARAGTVALLAALDARQLARTAEFEDYGPVTLRALVHYLCSHDQQHLAGLQWLRGKIEAHAR